MGEIEWTEETWNPVRGCTRISPGCQHCYAEIMAGRFSDEGYWGHGFAERTPAGSRWTGRVELIPEKLAEPLGWRKPRLCFVNSTSDLFHERLSNEDIAAVFGVMEATPHITYQILTKRAERLPQWFAWVSRREKHGMPLFPGDTPEWRIWQMLYVAAQKAGADVPPHHGGAWPLPNVHLGVSVENRKAAQDRVLHLLDVPAALHFLSVEPLLETVDLTRIVLVDPAQDPEGLLRGAWLDALRGHLIGRDDMLQNRIGWVIAGGESGPGARPCDVDWIRSAVKQCREAGVPVFVKQLGARPFENLLVPPSSGRMLPMKAEWVHDVTKPVPVRYFPKDRKGGDMSEWPADLRVREMPEVAR